MTLDGVGLIGARNLELLEAGVSKSLAPVRLDGYEVAPGAGIGIVVRLPSRMTANLQASKESASTYHAGGRAGQAP